MKGKHDMTRPTTRITNRTLSTSSYGRQRGQAMVEYLVGTIFVVMAVAFVANPTLFDATRDVLTAIKDYFKAFAYAISVAAT